MKWHSLLFGNNRKLVQVFAVVYLAVEYWILPHKRIFTCNNNKSKCLVQRFECPPVTPSAWVQIQLDEVFLYFLLNCVYYSQKNEVAFMFPCFIFYILFIFVFSSVYQLDCLNREKCPIKVVQNKNLSVWNSTQKASVTAHHIYHRANDDLRETYSLIYHKAIGSYIGVLFKSQFDSLISINKLSCIRNMYGCRFKPK